MGGCVRDFLLGKHPKDFDISTTARPRQIKKLIKNSFIIGKRFRLVLVRRGQSQYEVSTFRRGLLAGEDPGTLPDGDNIFGSPQQDAQRRDYTCNALFYDPNKRQIIDYTGGIKDLKEGWVKLIGTPEARLPEDPIRILRAVRFSAKLSLQIDPELKQGLSDHADELKFSPIPRRREEYLKILRLHDPLRVFIELKDLGVLDKVLPSLDVALSHKGALTEISKNLSFLDYNHRKDLEPSDLFGLLLFAMASPLSHEEGFDFVQWLESDEMQTFTKHELGMFNAEITEVTQAFRILPSLYDYESYSRKGERRQQGLVSQKAFPLALLLYAHAHGPDLGFWFYEAENGKS